VRGDRTRYYVERVVVRPKWTGSAVDRANEEEEHRYASIGRHS
jgi:hypothetical protein